MQSETLQNLVILPAWILLVCSVCLLVAAFARAYAGEFRRLLPSGEGEVQRSGGRFDGAVNFCNDQTSNSQ